MSKCTDLTGTRMSWNASPTPTARHSPKYTYIQLSSLYKYSVRGFVSLPSIYMWCTLLFLVHVLNLFPQTQKIIPQRHQSVIKDMFVMIGGTYPSSTIQELINFENP